MSGSRAAIRYAKATLQQANESSAGEAVLQDMYSIQATIKESKDLRIMLKSPVVKSEDKKAALLKIFEGCSSQTKSLISVLTANQRTDILGHVAQSYIHLSNEAKGVKVAQVTTAVPLTDALETQVLKKVKELTGSDLVTLTNEVDPSIIGGFVLRVGDMQYNASIANQLGTIKREFSKSL